MRPALEDERDLEPWDDDRYWRFALPATRGRRSSSDTVEIAPGAALCIAVECAAVISEPGLFDR
jgi:hypothetical protein